MFKLLPLPEVVKQSYTKISVRKKAIEITRLFLIYIISFRLKNVSERDLFCLLTSAESRAVRNSAGLLH